MRTTNPTPPVTLPAQTIAKKPYERPTFSVVPLNIEAPLLSASETKNGGVLKNLPFKDA